MRSRRCCSAIACLALIYLWSSYGLGPMIRWGARRGRGQLTGLGPLVARALPLLLLFTTFLFINAEVWQVAGALDGLPYVARDPHLLRARRHVRPHPGARLHPPGEPVRQLGRRRRATLADTPADEVELPIGEPALDPLCDAPAVERRPDRDLRPGAADHARRGRPDRSFFVLFGVLAIPADTVSSLDRASTISTCWLDVRDRATGRSC